MKAETGRRKQVEAFEIKVAGVDQEIGPAVRRQPAEGDPWQGNQP